MEEYLIQVIGKHLPFSSGCVLLLVKNIGVSIIFNELIIYVAAIKDVWLLQALIQYYTSHTVRSTNTNQKWV